MEIITQNDKHMTIKGDVSVQGKKIMFGDVVIGTYSDLKRSCEVFAELIYHSWNNVNGVYKMPKS